MHRDRDVSLERFWGEGRRFGFGFFGVILFTAGKYLEGVVEVGIGLPLLWYGAKDAVSNLLPSRLFTIVLLVFKL